MHPKSKLPNQGKTIFAIMSELANQHDAIDLSRGYPNFEVNPQLVDLYAHYLKSGYNQYAPVDGILPLRESLARKIESCYQTNYHPDTEITITSGATEAIFSAITTFVNDGDEVIIFEPAYDLYTPAVKINQGIPVLIELTGPKFSFNWDQVQKSVTAKTKMIIINNPHNPTGNIFSAWDMERLKKIVNGTNIIILSDEVYEHVVFDSMDHESVLAYPELRERSIAVFSFGKTFHATGWRLGYIVAAKGLMSEFRKVHQYSMYTSNTPAQHAINEHMNSYNTYREINELFEKKRNLFISGLKSTRFEFVGSKGTYFQNVVFKSITDENDFEFASRLIREYNVASIPLSYFYKARTDQKILRFCFAKTEDVLYKALEQLQKI